MVSQEFFKKFLSRARILARTLKRHECRAPSALDMRHARLDTRPMEFPEIAGLALAAAVGGAINAVAGGGTLVTFPALLFFGVPAINANATSTLALVIGTSGSIYGYREHVPAIKRWLWRFLPVSVLGGFLGALLLTHTSNKTFSKLVPFLILFATVLFFVQSLIGPRTRRIEDEDEDEDEDESPAHATRNTQHAPRSTLFALTFQFAVALYGGYFGAGIGILMLASLGWIGLTHIHQMNTLKTILSSLINLVAALWFIFASLVYWPQAAIMTLGALAGYFLGSHYAQRIPQNRVRQIIVLIGLLLSAVTFYKEFIH
ncbi:MAG: sulfite exporter TauE/SafE family protein [Verrucomicrobia bacterium]|nr:MAG: sulfite exporter TauE/SafE family protein [Verrucomicrobiota bacterium]